MKTIKQEWKIFCRKLYKNVLLMEKRINKEMEESFRLDKPYSDRKRLMSKLKMCEDYKDKIVKSVEEKEFELKDQDFEIIEKLGYNYYFKYLDCNL